MADNSLRFFADGNGDVVTLQTNGQLFVKVLTITGGADIVEPFQMSEPELSLARWLSLMRQIPAN